MYNLLKQFIRAIFFAIPMALLFSLPIAAQDGTEVAIEISYKLTSQPVRLNITIKKTLRANGGSGVHRKEVKRSADGLIGGLNAVTNAMDVSGYTKVGSVVKNGATYDIYEKSSGDTGLRLTGTAQIQIKTKPSLYGLGTRARVGEINIENFPQEGASSELNALNQELTQTLGDEAQRIVSHLNNHQSNYTEQEIQTLFSWQSTNVSKAITYNAFGEQQTFAISITSEPKRYINAPLGVEP